MVGDNPASDMALAAMGAPYWRGVLVKTGVYTTNDSKCGAIAVCEDVYDAVEFITANCDV